MSVPVAVDILMNAVEQTLADEHRALMDADADALLESCQRKQRVLEELDSVCGGNNAAGLPLDLRSRLRSVMVANARNQVLLSVLQTRLDERMQQFGMLDETYGRNGKRSHRSLRTATQSA